MLQRASKQAWDLARRQHGVIARSQLIELGFTAKAIKHRVTIGRLRPIWRGVYAVGRPELTQDGRWMAAVLACGPGAVLSHESAAALWRIQERTVDHADPRLRARQRLPPATGHRGPPARQSAGQRPPPSLPNPDHLAPPHPRRHRPRLTPRHLEAAINEADKLDLVSPEALRAGLDRMPRTPGIAPLRKLLDRRTFTLTDSCARAPLPADRPCRRSTAPADAGLRQRLQGRLLLARPRPRRRDRRPALPPHAGRAGPRSPPRPGPHRRRPHPLRFTRAQVRFEPAHVKATLEAVSSLCRTDTLKPRRGVEQSGSSPGS